MRKNIILWILEIALGVLGSIAVFWGYSSMNIFTLYGVLFVPGLLIIMSGKKFVGLLLLFCYK